MIFAFTRPRKRLASIALAAALSTALVTLWSDTSQISFTPVLAGEPSGITHCSLDESRKRVKESACLLRHCSFPYYQLPLRSYTLRDLLTSAIDLSKGRDGNAEYIIGWAYENNLCRSDTTIVNESRPLPAVLDWFRQQTHETILRAYRNPQAESSNNLPLSQQWYIQAASHGSPQAISAIALANMGYNPSESQQQAVANELKRAIDAGDMDAKVELGRLYQNKNNPNDLRQAMQLYEEAAQAHCELTANWALANIMSLWIYKHVTPSHDFAKGESDPFVFMAKFDRTMNAERYDQLYSFSGATPDPYCEQRWALFSKLRHGLGLYSEPETSH